MSGGLSCPRCAGLLVPDVDDAAYATCVNCGRSWRPEQVGRAVAVVTESAMVADQAVSRICNRGCGRAARAGFKTCQPCADASAKAARDCYAKRKKTLQQGNPKTVVSAAPATVGNGEQDKKKALNGNGADWKSQALSALVSQRETLTAKIHEIDTVMAAIQGM